MITPSHIIYSWALARKTDTNEPDSVNMPTKRRTLAFVLGALFPDTPTYLFFIVCGLILGYSGEVMWDEMYFNSDWSIPITLTHSFWLWPVLIGISTYFGFTFLRWFSISALLHALVDFLVHTDDAYRHFWPFSDWKFHSPVSYYRTSEYGNWVSAFDSLLVLGLLTYLYTKYTGGWRVLIIGIGVLYSIRLFVEPIMNMPYGS
jgi:hypothetical protein